MVVHVHVLVGFQGDVHAERWASVAVAPLVSVADAPLASVADAPLANVADAPLASVAVERWVIGVAAAAEAFVRVHVDDYLLALTAMPLIELQVVELTLVNSVTVSVVYEHSREPALVVAHRHHPHH